MIIVLKILQSKIWFFIQISYADYVYFEFLDICLKLDKTFLNGMPVTKGYYDLLASRPNIAKYLASDKRKNMKITGSTKEQWKYVSVSN